MQIEWTNFQKWLARFGQLNTYVCLQLHVASREDIQSSHLGPTLALLYSYYTNTELTEGKTR